MSKTDIPDKVGKYEVRGLVGRGAEGILNLVEIGE